METEMARSPGRSPKRMSERTFSRTPSHSGNIPIGTFTVGVEGIRSGEIDVVPIDSFSYDLMSRYTPAKLAGTRIIATTPASPFPPMVAAPEMPEATAHVLRKAFYRIHEAPEMARILKTLYLERFDPTEPTYYESMLKQAALAEAAGYWRPG